MPSYAFLPAALQPTTPPEGPVGLDRPASGMRDEAGGGAKFRRSTLVKMVRWARPSGGDGEEER